MTLGNPIYGMVVVVLSVVWVGMRVVLQLFEWQNLHHCRPFSTRVRCCTQGASRADVQVGKVHTCQPTSLAWPPAHLLLSVCESLMQTRVYRQTKVVVYRSIPPSPSPQHQKHV